MNLRRPIHDKFRKGIEEAKKNYSSQTESKVTESTLTNNESLIPTGKKQNKIRVPSMTKMLSRG